MLFSRLWQPRGLTSLRKAHSATREISPGHSSQAPFRLAVVGSGPAGFYTAYRVMTRIPHTHVDMYESLPVPFGLVRHGVAPDHPEVKNCQKKFEEVASSPTFRFFGNVSVGQAAIHSDQSSVRLQSLMRNYDCVLLAYGACEDRKLGIPGEMTLKGIHPARQFVGWYNGLPECQDLDPGIDNAEEAVVIGHGNVALDVARLLLEDIDVLRKTDITDQALQKLSHNRIKKVHVVGRRGPIQAAFTIKEVRELMTLPNVVFHPVDRSCIPDDLKTLPRASRRLMEVILKGSAANADRASKSWYLDSCLSPSHFFGRKNSPMTVGATEFNVMKLREKYDPKSTSFTTGQTVRLASDVVFRSIGYKSAPLPEFTDLGVQFDEKLGVVKNDGLGRVIQALVDANNTIIKQHTGLYCAGWVKTGPIGVIASTMQDAFMTGDAIIQDWLSGAKFHRRNWDEPPQGWDGLRQESGVRPELVVSWNQWQQIDKAERQRGEERGKPREKFSNITDILNVVR